MRVNHSRTLTPVLCIVAVLMLASLRIGTTSLAEPSPAVHIAAVNCNIHSTQYDPSSCCNIARGTYNTIICGRSESASEAYCERAMNFSATHPSGAYLAGSRARYRIRASEQDISGCFPAGLRRLSVSQELSPGTEKPFLSNSHVISTTTDYAHNLVTTVSAPYNCGVDTTGASVRVLLRLTWIGRPGWKAKPDSVALNSKPQPIC
jgi:hypothetical protein